MRLFKNLLMQLLLDPKQCYLTLFYCFFSANGLFPTVFNLASQAEITVNATCGQEKEEMYCRLVEHVRRRPMNRVQCGVCNENSSREYERHPVTNAIDGSNNWWQSPTIANGRKYHWVTITLDLKQVRHPLTLALFLFSRNSLPESFVGLK